MKQKIEKVLEISSIYQKIECVIPQKKETKQKKIINRVYYITLHYNRSILISGKGRKVE